MKKIYNYQRLSVIVLTIVLVLIHVISCQDDDFAIIPEPDLPQTITSIEPGLSDIGTTVNIIGTNFSPVRANNKVSFNGVQASVTIANDTILSVVVPEGATTGPVTVRKGKVSVNGPVFNVVPAPVITDLSATGSEVGESIVINGANFGETTANTMVEFNGVTAEISNASATEITVIVPEEATTGPLTVNVSGQIATIEVFTIAPVILSFEPTSGVIDDVIILTGTNFNAAVDNNNVSFNGIATTVISASTTQLEVSVPTGATTGKIAVEIEGLLSTSTADFTVEPPPPAPLIQKLRGTSFEEPFATDENYTRSDAVAIGDLLNNAGERHVQHTAVGNGVDDEIGFRSFFSDPNTSASSPGFTSEQIGVSNDPGPTGGSFADGNQAYQVEDIDGTIRIQFDRVPIDVTQHPSTGIQIQYFPIGGNNREDDDFIKITAIVERADGTTENLILLDIDGLAVNSGLGAWNLVDSGFLTNVTAYTLIVEIAVDSGSEDTYFDQMQVYIPGT